MNYIKKEKNLPELLAPAGSLEHLRAAVFAGADAVYMGGARFGARAYARNLHREEISEALRFTHFYEKKLYLTVNTLMKEQEIKEELGDFLFPYYEAGLDGVIVQDLGAARFIRKNFPEMEIHGSTQMTITTGEGARAAARMGMSRVVPARELSFKEIQTIREESGLEIEVFIHGALCYCYSGQCLFSSMYGGRSGNRGRCAQPCRLPYRCSLPSSRDLRQNEYLLSPKDLCSLPFLSEITEIPVDSLKIEGRMKNVEYVAGVTSIYRKNLDQLARCREENRTFAVNPEDIHQLQELYCRGSFTEGYWHTHNGKQMMAVSFPKNTGRKIGKILSIKKNQIRLGLEAPLHPKDLLVIPLKNRDQEEIVLTVPSSISPSDQTVELNAPGAGRLHPGMSVYRRKNAVLSEQIASDILKKEINYPVNGKVSLHVGQPARLMLTCKGREIILEGECVGPAQNRPLSKEEVVRQMNKTGGIPFTLSHLTIDMDPDCFLPMSSVKKLRQQGFQRLKECMETGKQRVGSPVVIQKDDEKKKRDLPSGQRGTPERICTVYHKDQLARCRQDPFFDGICLPGEFFSLEDLCDIANEGKRYGKNWYFSMPRVFRRGTEKIQEICTMDLWDGIYVYHMNEAQFLHELWEKEGISKTVIAASSFYQWNSYAVKEMAELYPEIKIRELPVELSGTEIKTLIEHTVPSFLPEDTYEMMVYGRLPVMQSVQCIKKTKNVCDGKEELFWLTDAKRRKLPVTSHCRFCYNLIWQDEPRNLIGEDLSVQTPFIRRHRFDLLEVTPEKVEEIQQSYQNWQENHFRKRKDRHFRDSNRHWNDGIE